MNVDYRKSRTALMIDPYNDFSSEGGKPHMVQVLNAVRQAGCRFSEAIQQ